MPGLAQVSWSSLILEAQASRCLHHTFRAASPANLTVTRVQGSCVSQLPMARQMAPAFLLLLLAGRPSLSAQHRHAQLVSHYTCMCAGAAQAMTPLMAPGLAPSSTMTPSIPGSGTCVANSHTLATGGFLSQAQNQEDAGDRSITTFSSEAAACHCSDATAQAPQLTACACSLVSGWHLRNGVEHCPGCLRGR